jgi:hypothetical protein
MSPAFSMLNVGISIGSFITPLEIKTDFPSRVLTN